MRRQREQRRERRGAARVFFFSFIGEFAIYDAGRSSFRTASPIHSSSSSIGSGSLLMDRSGSAGADKHLDPYEALEGFVHGLYVEALNALVALVNK